MRVVNFSEARNHFKNIVDQTVADADFTIISRRSATDAVLMSLDTLNSLMEKTIAIMSYRLNCNAVNILPTC